LIGPITLAAKHAGERSAGNPHAPFEVEGAGNVAMALPDCGPRRKPWINRHHLGSVDQAPARPRAACSVCNVILRTSALLCSMCVFSSRRAWSAFFCITARRILACSM